MPLLNTNATRLKQHFSQLPDARQRLLPRRNTHVHVQWRRGGLGAAFLGHDRSPLLHGVGQKIKNLDRVLPADAGVCDADAVLEGVLALLGDLLRACTRVRTR